METQPEKNDELTYNSLKLLKQPKSQKRKRGKDIPDLVPLQKFEDSEEETIQDDPLPDPLLSADEYLDSEETKANNNPDGALEMTTEVNDALSPTPDKIDIGGGLR